MWLALLPSGKTHPPIFLVQCLCLHLPTNILWSAHHTSAKKNQQSKKCKATESFNTFVCSGTSSCTCETHYKWNEREREKEKKHTWKAHLIPPLQSEHVESFLFPQLNASAFDPVSSEHLSRTGHRMRALGLPPPQGRNPDLKERSERKAQILGPWGEETDCLSGAYQAMESCMHSQASEIWY